MPIGMSRRAYAKSRANLDESMVRRYIASGVLAPALLGDGSIDAAKADRLLEASRTRGRATPVSLSAARNRKERILAQGDAHELDKLQHRLVRPDRYSAAVAEGFSAITVAIRQFPHQVAPRLVAQDARTIHRLLAESVNDLLNAMSAAFAQRADEERAALEGKRDDSPDLNVMTPTELATFRTNTQATRLELELAHEFGVLRSASELLMMVGETIAVTKSRLLALSGRLSASIGAAPDVLVVEALLTSEIEEIATMLTATVERLRAMQPQKAA